MSYLQDTVVYSKILNSNSTFVLVSYYWGETVVNDGSISQLTYGQQVQRLIGNCENLNINYYFVRVKDFEVKGSYQKALSYKPDFISKCLRLFPKYKCIFVDTDLQILKYPHLFEADADCWFVNWNEYDWKCYNPFQLVLPGAILGFANTTAAKQMLNILTEFMHANRLLAEDKSFSGIITRHFFNVYLRCVWLPESYMYMFEKHKYSSIQGKYTYVADLEYEMKGGVYKPEDLVMIHEDFETGNLDDIYDKKVGKNRFPPSFNRQQGEKLRCLDIVFKAYPLFGLTSQQANEYRVDFAHKKRNKLIKIHELTCPASIPIKHVYGDVQPNSNFIVVTRILPGETVTAFTESMKMYGLSYLIYTDTGMPFAQFIANVLTELKKDIRYLDVHAKLVKRPNAFYIKNMDLIMPNLNVMYSLSKCSDPRVLKTIPNCIYGFSYNQTVLDFLCIVQEHTKMSHVKRDVQHKAFEYAFNISCAINKLRCWWLGKEYLVGPIVKCYSKNELRDTLTKANRSVSNKYKQLTKKLEQCGLKPALDYKSDPVSTHFYGSRYPSIFHNRYGKYFLEYY
ncbi:hypothetical protein EB077_10415 [bacterium]|nr:hypothetical protein [bacterium]